MRRGYRKLISVDNVKDYGVRSYYRYAKVAS